MYAISKSLCNEFSYHSNVLLLQRTECSVFYFKTDIFYAIYMPSRFEESVVIKK